MFVVVFAFLLCYILAAAVPWRCPLKRTAAWVCVLLTILISATKTIHGQGNLGAITGTVADSSGAAVPDLPLTITNVETGVKWPATTSSAGYYRVAVPPGTYRLEAQDRKSTRLNSSHVAISYAVFCLKKKKTN